MIELVGQTKDIQQKRNSVSNKLGTQQIGQEAKQLLEEEQNDDSVQSVEEATDLATLGFQGVNLGI